jgi:hypothetical protein
LQATLDDAVYAPLSAGLKAWIDVWKAAGLQTSEHAAGDEKARRAPSRPKPTLTFSWSDDFLQIDDRRRNEHAVVTFEGPAARLYKAASDRPVTAAKAAELANVTVSPASVERGLNELAERGLMMRDGDKYLALALPATPGR